VEWGHGQIAHWSYTGGPGYSLFVPVENVQTLIQELTSRGIPQVDLETADVARLEYGRPRFGIDFTDTNIPQETQQMQAMHFSKGCYLGQEIVERVRSRGHVNKVLVSLDIDTDAAPARGTKVEAGGKETGEITSAVVSPTTGKVIAFAIVRAETLNSPLSVAGAPASVTERRARTEV
jgi:aminomethyltransferase